MIDPRILSQVRNIHLRMRGLVTDLLAGGYTSVFKGSGIEFEEVREFTEGDDIRSIDWNVTARTGRPHVKKFVEERELTIVFLMDMTRSLLFGSQESSPREKAAELCACVALAALRSNDKVGVLFSGRGPEKYVPARKGATHVLRVVREILAQPAVSAGMGMADSVEFLGRVLRRRSIVFLVSDFLFPLEVLENPLKMFARKHDVIGAHLLDPREIELPDVGIIEMQDSETGRRMLIDTGSRRVREEWENRGRARLEEIGDFLRKANVDRMTVRLDEPVSIPLLRLFRERERRRAAG